MTTPFYRSALSRMALAVAAGLALGHALPAVGAELRVLSDVFVKAIGMLIGSVMFCLVASGVAGIRAKARGARVGVKSALYFEAMNLLSLGIGVGMAYLLAPGAGMRAPPGTALVLPPLPAWDVQRGLLFLESRIPDSFVAAFANNNNAQIVLLAVLAGLGLPAADRPGGRVLDVIEAGSQVLHGMLALVLKTAPLAAFGAMAFVVGSYGMAAMLPLLRFVLTVHVASLVFALLLALIACAVGCHPLKLLRHLREPLLLVCFTTSFGALPGLTARMEQLGCAGPLVRLVLPASYNFNLAGTNLFLGAGVVFFAQQTGRALGWSDLALLLAIAMLASRGTVGVAGSAFAALAGTLSSLQMAPLGAIAALLGVERLMKCRSLTNVLGHVVACLVLCAWSGGLQRERLRRVLSASDAPAI